MDVPSPTMAMDIDLPAVEIEFEYARVQADVTGSYEDLGLKRSPTLARDQADKALQNGLVAIGQIAALGDRLAAIEKGGDLAQEITKLAWPHDGRQINVVSAPEKPVPIEMDPGYLTISLKEGAATVTSPPDSVKVDMQEGYVKCALAQRPELTIDVVGENFSVLA